MDDFDIDRSTEQAWAAFTASLDEVLAVMDAGATLRIDVLAADDGHTPFVAFACEVLGELMAHAAGNASLDADAQLGAAQLHTMTSLGWQAPPDPAGDFGLTWSQGDTQGLAALTVTTLREVYGVLHPVFLTPDHLADLLRPPAPTESVLSQPQFTSEQLVAVMPGSADHLSALVEAELATIFGQIPIRDEEGDLAIRVGSSMVFVRVTPDAREVIAFSPMVHDVDGRSRATEVLNDLNADSRFVRFWILRDRVFGSMSALANPFVPAHLHQVVQEVATVADSLDDSLAEKLRGRTSF